MSDEEPMRPRKKWAQLKHGVISRLLARPPKRGELGGELRQLATEEWPHPVIGTPVCFGVSTIQRWYYAARDKQDPVAALERKIRKDAGQFRKLTPRLKKAIRSLYKAYPRWTRKLLWKNLKKLVKKRPKLGKAPSYATVRRFMNAAGLERVRRTRDDGRPGAEAARKRREQKELRGYEKENVHELWHADFHQGSLKVLLPSGEWATPELFACIDDASRLLCHAQWYLSEETRTFVHGLSQALQKRGLPRELMTDNGGAMTSAEAEQGLKRLGIPHDTTLEYSPHQNGKIEAVWFVFEEQLLAMLERKRDLTLEFLNEATQVFVEQDYHLAEHSELEGKSPLERFRDGPFVGRECPSSRKLKEIFTKEVTRTLRKGDGTVGVLSKRFEVPSRYRHLGKLTVRYARWDLSRLFLTDSRSGKVLCELYPQDKAKNADGRRRKVEPVAGPEGVPEEPASPEDAEDFEIAPHLEDLLAQYAATGIPPAYVPLDQGDAEDEDGGEDS